MHSLTKLIEQYSINPGIVSAVLDRWRKGFVQSNDGFESHVYDDCVLSYFHVLEILVKEYEGTQKDSAKSRIRTFVNELLANEHMFRANRLEEKSRAKAKELELVLLSNDVFSITSKILFMLNQLSFLDNKVERLVVEFVKIRNNIAHGKLTIKENMIWPLLPSLTSVSQHDHHLIELFEVFITRLISKHFGLKYFESEWNECLEYMYPTIDVIRSVVNKIGENKISHKDFQDGNDNSVTPAAVSYAFFRNEIKLNEFQKAYDFYISGGIDLALVNDFNFISGIAVMCDYHVEGIRNICRELYDKCSRERTLGMPPKDVYRIIKSRGIELEWVKDYLEKNIA